MTDIPGPVAQFLRGRRIAVAGVSRDSHQVANAIYRKLRDVGHEVVPVNPRTSSAEGVTCYPDLASIPEPVSGVVVATHADAAIEVVRQSAECGVRQVWFHRSIGRGSVSDAAVQEAWDRGLACVVGGCPLMYCQPVDPFHRCFRWWLRHWGRVPG
jgi:hypothetical protein